VYGNSAVFTGEQVSLMTSLNLYETFTDVEKAIDLAFNGHFVLKFYDYLKIKQVKKVEIEEFIKSSTAKELMHLVLDLDCYLEGGKDEMHKQLREGYGHIPKPQARKIRNYLNEILEDALRYNHDRRRGRRKKETK
jgi:hypothetical protein